MPQNSQHLGLVKVFLVSPPHFSPLIADELNMWMDHLDYSPLDSISVTDEGVEFEAPLELACLLNSYLKLPNRILIRMFNQKCKDFKRLENLFFRFSWNPWLGKGDFNIKVSSKESRLFHKKNIEETVRKAIERYRKGQPAKANASNKTQTLYIRFLKDQLEVSLDLTGDHLHKRGYKLSSVKAPLRENLAAGLFYKMYQTIAPKENFELVDAMTGSGTMGFESTLFFNHKFEMREYAHEANHPLQTKGRANLPQPRILKLQLIEKDRSNFNSAQKNLEKLKPWLNDTEVKVLHGDYFELNMPQKESSRWVLCNPPYGERLQKEKLFQFYLNIIQRSFKANEADYLGLILPPNYMSGILDKIDKKIQLLEEFSFRNTRLPLKFLVFSKKH